MASKLKDALARQLRTPQNSMGWLLWNLMRLKSDALEKRAVKLCAIEPHHKVLEIGFGPGLGIQHALQYVKDGPGRICGVDLSPYMLEKASRRLRAPIELGKVQLGLGSACDLAYGTDTFDSVFHVNSYYFWPSMQDSLRELYRVMKPGATMVTVLSLNIVKKTHQMGLLKHANYYPLWYMTALELTGFKNVRIEYLSEGSLNYQAIFAELLAKEDDEYERMWGENEAESVSAVDKPTS